MSEIFKHKLGLVARDTVTGFQGVIIARTQWLNGCTRYILQPQKLHDGKPIEGHSIDEQQVELVEGVTQPAIVIPPSDKPGGPYPTPKQY